MAEPEDHLWSADHSLRNIGLEERSYHLLRGGSLKSHSLVIFSSEICVRITVHCDERLNNCVLLVTRFHGH
jgi:hypothetical protein